MNTASSTEPTRGPPTNLPYDCAEVMFATVIRPTLAESDLTAQFHRQIECDQPVSVSLVTQYLKHLKTLAAEGQSSQAWASINVALNAAVLNSHVDIVRALLNVPKWQLCRKTRAIRTAALHISHAETLLRLLLTDSRCRDQDILRPIVAALIENVHFVPRSALQDCHTKNVLHIFLCTPQVSPRLLWDQALSTAMCMATKPSRHGFVLPAVLHINALFDSAEWQFERARNHWITRDAMFLKASGSVPTRLKLGPPHPALLIDLPVDLQLQLHEMLDLRTLHSLRLTCRALHTFPMDRFAQRRVEHALQTAYDSTRLQHLMESIPGHVGPSVMDYLALVEAVRHLDMELALKFLYPLEEDIAKGYDLCRARDPLSINYVVAWAVLVLLKRLNMRLAASSERGHPDMEKGGILLQALLLHPMLSEDAWSLVLFFIDLCRSALVAGAVASDPACTNARLRISDYCASDPGAATAQLLIQLIRTGTLLDPIPPTLLADLHISNPSLANMSPITRVFILLCTVSYNPVTFTSLVRLFRSPPPTPIKQLLFGVLCARPDPNHYLTHVMTHLTPIPDSTIQYHASLPEVNTNEDVIRQLLSHIVAPKDVWSLFLLTSPTMSASAVRINALVLTHWYRLAAGDPKFKDWDAPRNLTARLDRDLQAMEAEGDTEAGERLRELRAVWEPIRAEQARKREKTRRVQCVVQ